MWMWSSATYELHAPSCVNLKRDPAANKDTLLEESFAYQCPLIWASVSTFLELKRDGMMILNTLCAKFADHHKGWSDCMNLLGILWYQTTLTSTLSVEQTLSDMSANVM